MSQYSRPIIFVSTDRADVEQTLQMHSLEAYVIPMVDFSASLNIPAEMSRYASIIEQHLAGETCEGIMMRRYRMYRLHLGQCICLARGLKDWSSEHKPLHEVMEVSQLFTEVSDKLNEIYVQLASTLKVIPADLVSLYDIMNKPASTYAGRPLTPTITVDELQTALENGFDPNTEDAYGSIIHYITLGGSMDTSSVDMLRLLLNVHAYLPTRLTSGTKQQLGHTWGKGVTPILHSCNQTKYYEAVILCAAGVDISLLDGRCNGSHAFNATSLGNCYWWRDNGNHDAALTCELAARMADPEDVIYREHIRTAYAYFNDVANGFLRSPIGVNLPSLLLLTCIIGDLFPIKYYLSQTLTTVTQDDVRQRLSSDVTFADIGLSLGHESVRAWLQEIGHNGEPNKKLRQHSIRNFKKSTYPLIEQPTLYDQCMSMSESASILGLPNVPLNVKTASGNHLLQDNSICNTVYVIGRCLHIDLGGSSYGFACVTTDTFQYLNIELPPPGYLMLIELSDMFNKMCQESQLAGLTFEANLRSYM